MHNLTLKASNYINVQAHQKWYQTSAGYHGTQAFNTEKITKVFKRQMGKRKRSQILVSIQITRGKQCKGNNSLDISMIPADNQPHSSRCSICFICSKGTNEGRKAHHLNSQAPNFIQIVFLCYTTCPSFNISFCRHPTIYNFK